MNILNIILLDVIHIIVASTQLFLFHLNMGGKNMPLVKLIFTIDVAVHNYPIVTKKLSCRFDGYSRVVQGCP